MWAYADDRNDAWEATQDTVQDNPLSDSATELLVNDIDGTDLWGMTPRIEAGNLLRIEDEFIEVTATNTGTNKATIIRGRNGTTAAAHAQNTNIDVWRPPSPVKQAALAQVMHQFKRGQAQYGDAAANLDMQKIMHIKGVVPDAAQYLHDAGYFELGYS